MSMVTEATGCEKRFYITTLSAESQPRANASTIPRTTIIPQSHFLFQLTTNRHINFEPIRPCLYAWLNAQYKLDKQIGAIIEHIHKVDGVAKVIFFFSYACHLP